MLGVDLSLYMCVRGVDLSLNMRVRGMDLSLYMCKEADPYP